MFPSHRVKGKFETCENKLELLSVSFETRNSFTKQLIVGELCEFKKWVCEMWASEEIKNLQRRKLYLERLVFL